MTSSSKSNISHPYPPSYRAQPSSASTPSSPIVTPTMPPTSQVYEYQPSSQVQGRYTPQPARPTQDSFAPRDPYNPNPNPNPEEGRTPSYPYNHPAESYGNGNSPNPNLNPYPAYQPQFQRSPSTSSFPPQYITGVDKNGNAYPEGWTKGDEDAEKVFLARGMFDWKEVRSWRFWIRKEWIWYYLGLAVISVLVILMALYHDQIVGWLTPVANYMKNLPAGWTIPIAVLVVISFPPLFGHEIVAVLCGVVWGLWVGFGIVAAGTFLGEVGNFYAFKYCLRGRAAKHEKESLNFACMAHIVRQGGFFIVFVARLSAIPGHLTTAVFATCGMNIWIFMIAAILSLPKQMITVYLGVILENKDKSSKDKIISNTVLAVSFLVTVLAAWYIYHAMHKARVVVWRQRRMALRAVEIDDKPKHQKRHSLIGAAIPMMYRDSFRKSKPGEELEEDDARSPILKRGVSYQNPYDISYNQSDEMSIYHVEDRHQTSNQQPHQELLARMSQKRPSNRPNPAFPEPRPAQAIATSTTLRRGDTTNSILSDIQENDYSGTKAEFPIPNPRGGGLRGDLSPARPESGVSFDIGSGDENFRREGGGYDGHMGGNEGGVRSPPGGMGYAR